MLVDASISRFDYMRHVHSTLPTAADPHGHDVRVRLIYGLLGKGQTKI